MKRVVPPSLTLKFTLSSVYTIIHNLTTPEMILCFDQDPRYDVSYPPLRVSLTEFSSSCSGKDVGKKITNIFVSNKTKDSSASSVKPDIIKMAATNIKSTAATIVINTRTSGEIYFLCIEAGYPRITEADDILSLANTDGITGKTESVSENVYDSPTAQINHVIDVPVEKLTSSTKYNFYAVLKFELGARLEPVPHGVTEVQQDAARARFIVLARIATDAASLVSNRGGDQTTEHRGVAFEHRRRGRLQLVEMLG